MILNDSNGGGGVGEWMKLNDEEWTNAVDYCICNIFVNRSIAS